jgi:hypothetical protein
VVLVILLGILAGVVSFLPLVGGLRLSRKVTSTSNLSHASTLLLAVFGSIVVLFGSAVICILVDRADALAFVFAEAGGIVVIAIAFGITKLVRTKKQQ